MSCCALADASKEKPFLFLAIGFILFVSLFSLGFFVALIGAPFSKRARVALRAMMAFVRVSLNEMQRGKSVRISAMRCKISSRLMSISPRLAGFVYRDFLRIGIVLLSMGLLAFAVFTLSLGLIIL